MNYFDTPLIINIKNTYKNIHMNYFDTALIIHVILYIQYYINKHLLFIYINYYFLSVLILKFIL